MSAKKIDVKDTRGPFCLGRADKWSREDLAHLLQNGATVNKIGYLHIPLSRIEGEVLLGIGQKQSPGEDPPELFVGGRKINMGRKPFVGHEGEFK